MRNLTGLPGDVTSVMGARRQVIRKFLVRFKGPKVVSNLFCIAVIGLIRNRFAGLVILFRWCQQRLDRPFQSDEQL
jgi:hypothetical protein